MIYKLEQVRSFGYSNVRLVKIKKLWGLKPRVWLVLFFPDSRARSPLFNRLFISHFPPHHNPEIQPLNSEINFFASAGPSSFSKHFVSNSRKCIFEIFRAFCCRNLVSWWLQTIGVETSLIFPSTDKERITRGFTRLWSKSLSNKKRIHWKRLKSKGRIVHLCF